MRPTARDRFLAWLVGGPIGHLAAFVMDIGGAAARYWWARARGRPDPFKP